MEPVMDALSEHWGKLNVLIHSIAFAPKDALDGRDAADVPITHTFGPSTLVSFKVWTDEVS
jgi:enoyl-[acyl-carrier-protein] reductase (NADH)